MVVDSFVGLWNAIQPVLSILATALMPIFNIVASFLGGVFKGVLLGVAGTFDILKGVIEFLTPVFDALVSVLNFISPVLQKIAEWVGVAIGLFANLGQAGSGLKTMMKSAWENISNAISTAKNIIHGSITAVSNVFNTLKAGGNSLKTVLQTAWRLITSSISGAVGKITGYIGNIKNLFNSLKNINLFNAGKSIINGFLRGLKSAWKAVTGFIGGIAGWIKDHKGPISYDRKLLIPAGNAIIGGLNKSMINSFKDVKANVLSMAGEIYDGFDINVKPINLSPDISDLDKNILDKKLDSNLDFNAYSEYKANRDSKLESMLLEILSLLKIPVSYTHLTLPTKRIV